MTKEEKILKKAEEIMRNGEFGSLSDFEVTTHVALETAKWADRTMLDKACEWLMLNADDYIFEGVEEYSSAMRHDFIENFRKAMEKE